MGLHLDIEKIYNANAIKKANGHPQKQGFLVWQGDKLTTDQKKTLQEENNKLFGLSEEHVAQIKLPKASNV